MCIRPWCRQHSTARCRDSRNSYSQIRYQFTSTPKTAPQRLRPLKARRTMPRIPTTRPASGTKRMIFIYRTRSISFTWKCRVPCGWCHWLRCYDRVSKRGARASVLLFLFIFFAVCPVAVRVLKVIVGIFTGILTKAFFLEEMEEGGGRRHFSLS